MIPSFNWDEVLKQEGKEEVARVLHILSKTGMLTDDVSFVSTIMLKQAKSQLIKRLVMEGYEGGELLIIGDFYPRAGQFLAIYDSNQFKDYNSAKKFLDTYVKGITAKLEL